MADLTLAGFVLARLAEDAEGATDATPGPWAAVDPNKAWGDDYDTHLVGGGKILATLRPEYRGYFNGLHIARWDPQRVLAEVALKRRILARHSAAPGGEHLAMPPYCAAHAYRYRDGTVTYPVQLDICPELRDLAAIWAGHAEYRAEWAPDAP